MRWSSVLTDKKAQGQQLAGLLGHAAVRARPSHMVASGVDSELRTLTYDHGYNFSSIPARAPVSGNPANYATPACPAFPRRCPFGGACHACPVTVQAKLAINQPGDSYEQEADRIADLVIATPAHHSVSEVPPRIQRFAGQPTGQSGARHASVDQALASPGRPLEPALRQDMEQRFDQDFSRVRVRTSAVAEQSARDVNAHAYTVGHNIVFGAGQFAPNTHQGRRLIAHELTHVLQQDGEQLQRARTPAKEEAATGGTRSERGKGPLNFLSTARTWNPVSTEPLTGRRGERAAGGALARESGVLNEFGRVRLHATRPSIARLNRPQTAAVLSRGPIAGVQFYPLAVAGTRVGPVSGRGGMVRDVAPERLSVIIGRGTSLRDLARVLLPLWNTATPFTPSGSAAPLPLVPLSVDELARGLLVYNRYYLPVPAMTAWNFGLRFPLPVEIDRDSGEGVIHPEIIRRLAGTFDLAWEPLLDRFPAAPVSPAAADLDRAVATFLAAHPENYARGIHLATRVVTNALAEREFVLAVLGRAGDAFELALSFVDALVVHQVSLLASTRAGADVLDRIRALLGANTGTVSERQRARLDRATGMLARTAGAVARPAPYVLPDATRPLDLRRQTDITLFAMNLFAEAGFEIAHYGLNSIRAVAQVVLNRVRCGYAGTPRDVILAHAQFSWTLATSPVHDLPFTPVRNPRNEPIWLDCLDVAAAALGGTMANPGVDNADSYYNPAAASPAWGTPATFVVRIGNHNFHRLRCPAP